MSKKILITGSEGFIGKSLIEKFKETNYSVFSPTKSELDLLDTGNVQQFLQNNSFDIIIHTANYGKKDSNNPDDYLIIKNGLKMFFNIARCHKSFGKMLYFGSGAEYDKLHYIPFMKEEYFDENIPDDSYGFYKYTLAKLVNSYDNIVDLRLFGVVGKYEQIYRFITNNVCRGLKGLPLSVNSHCYFDYISIADVFSILDWFINNDQKYKHYNVCRGEHIDLFDLAGLIKNELNLDSDIILKKDSWNPEYSGDNTRLITEIGSVNFSTYKSIVNEIIEYNYSMIDSVDINML